MNESTTARFRGPSYFHSDFVEINQPKPGGFRQVVESNKQLRVDLRSTGPVPAAIQELLDKLNQRAALLEITQQEDGSFTLSVTHD